MNDLLAAALAYAGRGWSVIPLKPHDKTPLSALLPRLCNWPRAQDETNGRGKGSWLDAQGRRADEAQIRWWWSQEPDANVGIVTGRISNLVVLDVDGPIGLQRLLDYGGFTPNIPVVFTGKGWHCYHAHPGRLRPNFGGLGGAGLDIRADGGFVVAPPSRHPNGHRYEWVAARARPGAGVGHAAHVSVSPRA